jgi:hypothetical protein
MPLFFVRLKELHRCSRSRTPSFNLLAFYSYRKLKMDITFFTLIIFVEDFNHSLSVVPLKYLMPKNKTCLLLSLWVLGFDVGD